MNSSLSRHARQLASLVAAIGLVACMSVHASPAPLWAPTLSALGQSLASSTACTPAAEALHDALVNPASAVKDGAMASRSSTGGGTKLAFGPGSVCLRVCQPGLGCHIECTFFPM